jgi:hypothetical protein
MSTSLQSLPGLVSESRRSSTIGSAGWLLKSIALRNLFLAGRCTGRAQKGALRQQMNFLTLPYYGLEIQILVSEHLGRRAKGSQSSLRIAERY